MKRIALIICIIAISIVDIIAQTTISKGIELLNSNKILAEDGLQLEF